MAERGPSLFAGREIFGMPVRTAGIVAVSALAAGVLVAWGTTLIPGFLAAPEPSASPSPSPTVVPTEGVIVPSLEPILRDLDQADRDAGVTSLDFTYQGAGTFTVMPGKGEPRDDGTPVRWISISVEDGIEADPNAFTSFVLTGLNDERGWGAEGRLEFVQTDGAADYRIMLASPFTAAAICPNNHVAAQVGPVTEATASEDATLAPTLDPGLAAGDPAATGSPAVPEGGLNPACAVDGVVVISMYEWSAGFVAFGQDRTAARHYIVNHQLGHLFGHEESACVSGVAAVMDDQRVEMPQCTANAWPYPDAAGQVAESPSP